MGNLIELADEVYAMRKLILLLILLGSIMLLHSVVSSETTEAYEHQDLYVLAVGSPTFVKTEVRATKIDKPFFNIISQYDWDNNIAWAVMMAESSGNPQAHNSKDYHRRVGCWGSYGLFQMGCIHFGHYGLTWDNKFSPEENIQSAYLLWKQRGWKEWGAYTDGSYRKFLY